MLWYGGFVQPTGRGGVAWALQYTYVPTARYPGDLSER